MISIGDQFQRPRSQTKGLEHGKAILPRDNGIIHAVINLEWRLPAPYPILKGELNPIGDKAPLQFHGHPGVTQVCVPFFFQASNSVGVNEVSLVWGKRNAGANTAKAGTWVGPNRLANQEAAHPPMLEPTK